MKTEGWSRAVNSIGVVFPFNEVNAGVFQNAGLWCAKTNFGLETTAYSPGQFRGLYFAAEKVVEICPLPFSSYQEVAEYEPNSISRTKFSTWFSRGMVNYLKHQSLETLPAALFHSLPYRLRSDYKTTKYLVRSGILELTQQNFYSNNASKTSLFLGDGLYFNMAKNEKHRKNLTQYFQYSFENLYNMIASHHLNQMGYIADSEKLQIVRPLEFLQRIPKNSPKIFLRTRNINSSVRFQNAPVPELRDLVNKLLSEGIVVVNSGVPAANLNLNHENYLEFSHNLPISAEMYLAEKFDYVMQTAWAGAFTAFASFVKPLITFNEEWSQRNIVEPVSLLKARDLVGIKDIQLGVNFADNRESVDKSFQKIIKNW